MADFYDPPRTGRALHPGKLPASLRSEAWEVDGFQVLTLHPQQPGKGQVFFLPGGAYLLEPTPFHARIARILAEDHGFTVSLFAYPLAPENDFRTTRRVTLQAYLSAAERFPDQELFLLGDSAGGGLGLGLLQRLRDQKIGRRPRKSVLVSPWVDLTMSNPAIAGLADQDPLLPLAGLRYAARLYSAGLDLLDPGLSPLYGDLSDLGRILLFCGTREVLYPDCQTLAAKLSSAPGSQVEVVLGEGLFHDWVIFPLPESSQAIKKIGRFLEPERSA